MNIKKSIKITQKKISNLLTMIIIVLILLMLTCVSLFLYKNLYQTIIQTKEIIILREKVALDTINMQKFNLIMEKLTKKISPQELQNINNIFH